MHRIFGKSNREQCVDFCSFPGQAQHHAFFGKLRPAQHLRDQTQAKVRPCLATVHRIQEKYVSEYTSFSALRSEIGRTFSGPTFAYITNEYMDRLAKTCPTLADFLRHILEKIYGPEVVGLRLKPTVNFHVMDNRVRAYLERWAAVYLNIKQRENNKIQGFKIFTDALSHAIEAAERRELNRR